MPKFGAQIDTQLIPIKGMRPEQSTVFPASPVEGQMIHRTDQNKVYQYLAGAWQQIAPAGAPLTHTHDATDIDVDQNFLQTPGAGDLQNTLEHMASSIGAKAPISHTHLWAHITDKPATFTPSTHTHDSSQVTTPTGNIISAGTLDDALMELDSWISAHEGANAGNAHPAIGISFAPTGNIAATTVQAAIAELDTEKIGIAGNVTITGTKTFSTAPVVPDNSFAIAKVSGLQSALNDKASTAYVDTAVQGLSAKEAVAVATTGNITLSGIQNIDGVANIGGLGPARVLVKDQTNPAQNGIYIAGSGAWVRSPDADDFDKLSSAFVFVEKGTVNADTAWLQTEDATGTIGTNNVTWVPFANAAAVTAGAGLTKTGNTIDVVGTANRITVAADSIDIASNYAGQTSITTLGTIATGTWNATTIAVNKGGTGATDAATARTNLGVLADQAAGTASMRTLGTGATQAAAGNHTHAFTAITGTAALTQGGTGATTAAAARTNLVAAGAYSVTFATALTAGTWSANITHNLNSQFVDVAINDAATGEEHILDWKTTGVNTIQIRADIAYAANALRVLVTSK